MSLISIFHSFLREQHEMNIEFERRANEALKRYYNARKLPRKMKKRVRKEAIIDFNFYKSIQLW